MELVGKVFEIFPGEQDVQIYGRVPHGDRKMRQIRKSTSSFRFLVVKIKDNSRESQKIPSSQCDSHQQKLLLWMTRDREEMLCNILSKSEFGSSSSILGLSRISICSPLKWLHSGIAFVQLSKVFQRPRLYLSAVNVSRAPKSRGMSGNIPPDFAYLGETKGSAHRTSVVQDFVRHAHLEDER